MSLATRIRACKSIGVSVLPALQDNYIFMLKDVSSGWRAVLDPGEAQPVNEYLKDDSAEGLQHILLTHHHTDHTAGVEELRARYHARVVGCGTRLGSLDQVVELEDKMSTSIQLDGCSSKVKVMNMSGHTYDHVAYLFHSDAAGKEGSLFCGDALFPLGCGRVFDGNLSHAWRSIESIMELADTTSIFSAHEYTEKNAEFALWVDQDNKALQKRCKEVKELRSKGLPTVPTSVGLEKATNPFMRAFDESIRRRLGIDDPTVPDADVFAVLRERKDSF